LEVLREEHRLRMSENRMLRRRGNLGVKKTTKFGD
jgi:hypothetical protein